ncbi:MAG: hypothetical protein AAF512_07870 [Pseudomonadota bacterium]
MAEIPEGYKMRLEPEDEYCHTPDAAKNYNESMYFNCFDPERKTGGWFRLGNRVNEGYAEMSNCLYLPDGRVGFMFARAKIDNNDEMKAGGMTFEVVEPFKKLRVSYDGKICLLERPFEMAHPSKAFKENPMLPCKIDLDYTGVSPMYGGQMVKEDGSEIEIDPEKSFAKAHYEQHMEAKGTIQIADEHWDIHGFGLRDKSWGPRHWQAIYWYRWLPMNFGKDFAMMFSIVAGEDGEPRRGGMILRDNEYIQIRDCDISTEWDENGYQTGMKIRATTDEREYEVEGKVMSLIPLRNRRKTPDGRELLTRITEGMTEFHCDGKTGYGLSEYLDQIVDGKPVGADFK